MHLALQLRWEYHYFENGPRNTWGSSNEVLFRRIRTSLGGSFFDEHLRFALQLNLVPDSLELLDMWLELKLSDPLRLRIGLAKIPFTRYRLASFQDRPVVEWSFPTRYLGAERQMGITLHNGLGGSAGLEYQIGVFTGVNARASNGAGLTRIFAEPKANPSSLDDPASYGDMHTELVAHLAYNAQGILVRRPTDLEGGPPRFLVGMSLAWDLDPVPRQDMRLRIAPEVDFRAYGFALCVVFYLGLHDQVTGTGTYRPGMTAGLVQASYFFLERYELAARYTLVHILDGLRKDARNYAEEQMSAPQDPAEIEAVTDRYREVGLTRNLHEVNLGFNCYLHGTALKWQLDLGLILHDRVDRTFTDLQFRTQLQLAF